METLYKCDGCGGSFEASEVFIINGGEKLLCTGCNLKEEDLEVVEIYENE